MTNCVDEPPELNRTAGWDCSNIERSPVVTTGCAVGPFGGGGAGLPLLPPQPSQPALTASRIAQSKRWSGSRRSRREDCRWVATIALPHPVSRLRLVSQERRSPTSVPATKKGRYYPAFHSESRVTAAALAPCSPPRLSRRWTVGRIGDAARRRADHAWSDLAFLALTDTPGEMPGCRKRARRVASKFCQCRRRTESSCQ